MKPITFKEKNVVFAENQPEYLPLPAFKDSGEQGHVITCWKFTFRERLRILFGKNLWFSTLTFHKPLQPIHLTTDKPVFYTIPELNEN